MIPNVKFSHKGLENMQINLNTNPSLKSNRTSSPNCDPHFVHTRKKREDGNTFVRQYGAAKTHTREDSKDRMKAYHCYER